MLEIHKVGDLTENVPFTVYDAENINRDKEDADDDEEDDSQDPTSKDITPPSRRSTDLSGKSQDVSRSSIDKLADKLNSRSKYFLNVVVLQS